MNLERVEVMHMLGKLKVRNLHLATAQEACFSCPFPGHSSGDSSPSAYMNLETTAWMCHGCKRKGNAVHFVSELENIPPFTAMRYLREAYESDFREPDGLLSELEEQWASKPELDEPLKVIPEELLQRFGVHWEFVELGVPGSSLPSNYMQERGFSYGTLSHFGIGYDWLTDRFTIPLCNHQGDVVGFKGRAWQPQAKPKYLVIGGPGYGFDPVPVGRIVFNIHEANSDAPLILCEGELNAMALWQAGYTAAGLPGAHLTEEQAQLVRSATDEVILFFDSDQAGCAGAAEAIEMLEPYMTVRVVPDHEGDPASMDAAQIAQVLNGCLTSPQIQVHDLT